MLEVPIDRPGGVPKKIDLMALVAPSPIAHQFSGDGVSNIYVAIQSAALPSDWQIGSFLAKRPLVERVAGDRLTRRQTVDVGPGGVGRPKA